MSTGNTQAGRVALVTGGSRGIGEAVARRLAADGYRVAIVGRDVAALERVADAIGALPIAIDVTLPNAADRFVEETERALGPLDLVVPNAAIEAAHKLEDTSDEAWDALMLTNATSVFRLCRAVVPAMVRRGRGRVVVVASNAGLAGYAYTSAYCASKHAAVGLVRAIAAEIARTPVTINAVCPGFVDTEMTARSIARIVAKTGKSAAEARAALEALSPQRRLVTVDEVARLVAMLASDAARGIHGQAIAIDGGQTT